jgi:hypothetical protein
MRTSGSMFYGSDTHAESAAALHPLDFFVRDPRH